MYWEIITTEVFMEGITKEQADVIGEVANICTGNAATTLSMILNHPTNITTPTVEVLKDESTLVRADHILVKVPYTKGLDGTNLMVLRERDAFIIANLMMGGDGSDVSQMKMDDLTLSAISEAMNQMCGTIATSMATLLKRPTDIGYPLVNSAYRKTFEIPDELCNGSDIVKVVFHLTVEGLIDSELLQLYPLSIVKQILKQEEI
jgi:flagellar motor switch protein FliN/FliY